MATSSPNATSSAKNESSAAEVSSEKKPQQTTASAPKVEKKQETPTSEKKSEATPQKSEDPDLSLTGGDDALSEDDISNLMTEAIEQKKQEKFSKMIEKGSAIAAKSQDQAIDQIAEISDSQKGSANTKIAMAVVQKAQADEESSPSLQTSAGMESAQILMNQGVKAESIDADFAQTSAEVEIDPPKVEVKKKPIIVKPKKPIIKPKVKL